MYDEFAVAGSTAVFKCQVPAAIKHLLRPIGWLEEPSGRQYSPLDPPAGNRSALVLPTGELYLQAAAAPMARRRYRCKLHNQLTGELITSTTAGKLILTGESPLGSSFASCLTSLCSHFSVSGYSKSSIKASF